MMRKKKRRGSSACVGKRMHKFALPESSITTEKHRVLRRTAHPSLRERHTKECPLRFDVVAVDGVPGQLAVVRPQAPLPTSLTPRVRKSLKSPLRYNMRFTWHAAAE